MDNSMFLFKHFGMGEGPTELQHKLASVFLILLDQDAPPSVIAFYGDGVKLVCDGSPVVNQLRTLSDKGVRLIVCQACLEYLGLRDKLRIGIIGGMGDIIAAMKNATKVISV